MMDLRLFTASVLLLGTSAFAQNPLVPGVGQAPAPVAQDPDKQAPTPAELQKQLQAERDRLAREIAYVKDRAKNAKALLSDKLGNKAPSFRSIDAGVSAPAVQPMMPTQPRQARVATGEEMGNHGNDTLLVVNNRAVPQGAFDEIMAHLAKSPSGGDEAMRAQRALFDLIRIEAIASSFEDNEAAERVGDLLGQLDAGKPIADLAKAVGVVPGSSPEGKLEVTRNSVFGPRFEQVAFATEAGKRARPFRNANGIVILHVDSFVKGENPDLDKVVGTAIQVPYTPDQPTLQKAHSAVNMGQVDVLARDQKTLDMLPEMFRRSQAPMTPAVVDTAAIAKQIEQLAKDIGALQDKPDDESKRKLQLLQQQLAQLQAAMRSADAGDAAAAGTLPVKTVDQTATMKQLEAVSARMAALQGKTDEASKQQLQALQQQYMQLKMQLRSGTEQAPDEIKVVPQPPVKKN